MAVCHWQMCMRAHAYTGMCTANKYKYTCMHAHKQQDSGVRCMHSGSWTVQSAHVPAASNSSAHACMEN